MKSINKIIIMFLLLVTAALSQERIVTMPGTFLSELGGKDWDEKSDITKMTSLGDDLYSLTLKLPKGNYKYKVAIDKSWQENYGSNQGEFGDMSLVVPMDNTEVKFTFDYKTKQIKHEVGQMVGYVFIPVLTNMVEQKGKNAPINFTNEFELGVISKDLNVESKFSYNFDYDKNESSNKLTNFGDDFDAKNLKIESLSADYKTKVGTESLVVNKTNVKSSTDYFGILDTKGKRDDGDNRENTKAPVNIAPSNTGVSFSTDKFAKIDVTLSKYVLDIYEKSKAERVFSSLNVEKEINKNLTLGTSNVFYQVTHEDKNEDFLMNGTLYGKYDITNKLSFKGEVAYAPTGSIKDSAGLIIEKTVDGKWAFTFDPTAYGFAAEDVNEVYIVGTFNSWDQYDETYKLTKKSDVMYTGEFSIPSGSQTFKIMCGGSDWSKAVGIGGKGAFDGFPLVEMLPTSEGLKNGFNGYMAELNYKINDKGNVQFGTKSLAKNIYMPFAKDELLDDKKTGFSEYYLNSDYNLTKNSKLIFEKAYKTGEDNSVMLSDKTKLGFDVKNLSVTEYLKGYVLVDEYDKDDFDGKTKEVFVETNLNKLPFVKYAKVGTTQRFDSKTSEYFLDTELKDMVYFIDHIKGSITYAKDDVNYKDKGNALYYLGEIKLDSIPLINSFIPYITASYESDDNGNTGIVESKDYMDLDDNDNDWLKRIKVETKLSYESLEKWDGLTIAYETRKVEEGKIKTPRDFAKDEEFYVANKRAFIDWTSILTLSTGYTFPADIKAKCSYKYDINHGNASEFEDDGIKFEIEKKIGKTTINASYNKQDHSEGDDYTKVVFKTVF